MPRCNSFCERTGLGPEVKDVGGCHEPYLFLSPPTSADPLGVSRGVRWCLWIWDASLNPQESAAVRLAWNRKQTRRANQVCPPRVKTNRMLDSRLGCLDRLSLRKQTHLPGTLPKQIITGDVCRQEQTIDRAKARPSKRAKRK